jgi:hypothetical protein
MNEEMNDYKKIKIFNGTSIVYTIENKLYEPFMSTILNLTRDIFKFMNTNFQKLDFKFLYTEF